MHNHALAGAAVVPPLGTTRTGHTATALDDGRVLVVGGYNGTIDASPYGFSSAELYDPADGIWRPAGHMSTPRSFHTAMLHDGRVWIFGGVSVYDETSASSNGTGGHGIVSAIEVFDPAEPDVSKAWSIATGIGGILARAHHTMTRIPLGGAREFYVFAGGIDASDPTKPSATWQAFWPVTHVAGPIEPSLSPRSLHAAAYVQQSSLPGVLITGGHDGKTATKSAVLACTDGEVFLTPTHFMNESRAGHTLTVLKDGRILAAGGFGADGSALSSAEIFDPDRMSWTTVSPMGQARQRHSAILLTDGSVLVKGGYDDIPNKDNKCLSTAEIYEPAQDRWTRVGSMAVARESHTSTEFARGKVLVFGGDYDETNTHSAEVFDSHCWATPGEMSSARKNHTATMMSDGTLLITGGWNAEQGCLASAESCNPATAVWTPMESMFVGRIHHTATKLADGRLLVIGGWNPESGFLRTAEIYDPAKDEWFMAGTLRHARACHTATVQHDGRVIIAGGWNSERPGKPYLETAEIFDPSTGGWICLGAELSWGRASHSATLLDGGYLLVAGGYSLNNHRIAPIASVEVLDLLYPSNGWRSYADMSEARANHTATLVGENVLVTGGIGRDEADRDIVHRSAEIFESKTRTWRRVGEMLEPRFGHRAVQLDAGSVLVVGGINDPDRGECAKGSEIFSFSTETWVDAGSPDLARAGFQATYAGVTKGLVSVLVTGGGMGYSDVTFASMEEYVYDPTKRSGSWQERRAGCLTGPRAYHTASMLADGRILVAGGSATGLRVASDALKSAELYDPQEGSVPAGDMQFPRLGHSATPLRDGRVFVAGSMAPSAPQIFDPGVAPCGAWLPAGPPTAALYDHAAVHFSREDSAGRPDAYEVASIAGGLSGDETAVDVVGDYVIKTGASSALWNARSALAHPTAHPTMTQIRRNTQSNHYDDLAVAIGGRTGTGVSSAIALYDHQTPVKPLPVVAQLDTPREYHTATLLKDGRSVLVVGGRNDTYGTLASAEVFDSWSGSDVTKLVARMNVARHGHTASLLADGTVLVTGGQDNSGNSLASAEVYDPSRNRWDVVSDMQTPRCGHTATVLGDGASVQVIGGVVAEGLVADDGEIYRGVAGRWRSAGRQYAGVPGYHWQMLDRWQGVFSKALPGEILDFSAIPEASGVQPGYLPVMLPFNPLLKTQRVFDACSREEDLRIRSQFATPEGEWVALDAAIVTDDRHPARSPGGYSVWVSDSPKPDADYTDMSPETLRLRDTDSDEPLLPAMTLAERLALELYEHSVNGVCLDADAATLCTGTLLEGGRVPIVNYCEEGDVHVGAVDLFFGAMPEIGARKALSLPPAEACATVHGDHSTDARGDV